MKERIISIICVIMILAQTSFADGTFSLEELKPILNQKPELARYLFSTLDFAETGMAGRIGSEVNMKLGGKRIGPYEIGAKPKGAGGSYIFEVIVHTEQSFIGEKGNAANLGTASSVIEKLKYIEIWQISDTPDIKPPFPTSRLLGSARLPLKRSVRRLP